MDDVAGPERPQENIGKKNNDIIFCFMLVIKRTTTIRR